MVSFFHSIAIDTIGTKDNNGTRHLTVLGLYQSTMYIWKTVVKKSENGVRGPTIVNVRVVVAGEWHFKLENAYRPGKYLMCFCNQMYTLIV